MKLLQVLEVDLIPRRAARPITPDDSGEVWLEKPQGEPMGALVPLLVATDSLQVAPAMNEAMVVYGLVEATVLAHRGDFFGAKLMWLRAQKRILEGMLGPVVEALDEIRLTPEYVQYRISRNGAEPVAG